MSDDSALSPVGTIAPARAPATPDDKLLAAVFAAIASGEAARNACAALGLNERRFWRLLHGHSARIEAYQVAMAARAEVFAEQRVAIADEAPPMVETKYGRQVDAGYVAWQKNRIYAREWEASRLLPKRYGDRLELDAKVSIGDAIAERLAKARARAIEGEAEAVPVPRLVAK